MIRSAVDLTDVNVVSRSAAWLAAPDPDTPDPDHTDQGTTGIPPREAAVGREAPESPAAGHNDVRATRRRQASGWLGRYIGLVISGIVGAEQSR